jgi:hypothetical protein
MVPGREHSIDPAVGNTEEMAASVAAECADTGFVIHKVNSSGLLMALGAIPFPFSG